MMSEESQYLDSNYEVKIIAYNNLLAHLKNRGRILKFVPIVYCVPANISDSFL